MDEREYLLSSSLSELKRRPSRGIGAFWRHDCWPCIPARYGLALIAFLGFCNVYALRVNLSMAIVLMVNTSESASDGQHVGKRFDWSNSEQGWILASFFYGYLVTQIPGGWLATRFGGKYIFGIGIVMTSVLTLLTPVAADISIWCLVAVRVLEGLFEGVTFPAMHALWGKWAPPNERSRLATFAYSGQYVGSVLSFPLSAVLGLYGFDGGWPSIFYVFGSLGILWFVVWLLFAFDSPDDHPRISDQERLHIESAISQATVSREKTPWLRILTSPPVWAIVVAHFCANYGFYSLLTCLPTYYKEVLNLTMGKGVIENGLYSALPYLAQTLVVLLSGSLADLMISHCFSTTIVRKIFTSSSMFLSALFLLLCGYFGTTKLVSVTLLTLGVGLGGLGMAGFAVNHIDIAPHFAGVLMGITNTAGTIPGILGPQIAKLLTPNSAESIDAARSEWRAVFIITAEVYVFGALIYLILADGKKQWWVNQEKPEIVPRWLRQPNCDIDSNGA